MELYEIRYFLGVAKLENIHGASRKMNISTASLSKAIGRLEAELGVSLFTRERRNIRLTAQGRLFQKRAGELLQLEESLKHEISGHPGRINVVIAGPEIFLSHMGTTLTAKIKQRFSSAHFEFHALSETAAVEQVARGEAHFAIVSGDVPPKSGLTSKVLFDAKFETYVGLSHELAKAKKPVAIEELLKHAFVSPDQPLLGKVGARQSLDGWRDDQFPRKVEFLTSSLKILEELAVKGSAVAYLPNYCAAGLPLVSLKITGCPYTCSQKIKLVAKNPKDTSWIRQIW